MATGGARASTILMPPASTGTAMLEPITDHKGLHIVSIGGRDAQARRYFVQDGEQLISKALPSLDTARAEAERLLAKRARGPNPWRAPWATHLIAPGVAVIQYPLGRALLLALSGGHYPPRGPHNSLFVVSFPWMLLYAVFGVMSVLID